MPRVRDLLGPLKRPVWKRARRYHSNGCIDYKTHREFRAYRLSILLQNYLTKNPQSWPITQAQQRRKQAFLRGAERAIDKDPTAWKTCEFCGVHVYYADPIREPLQDVRTTSYTKLTGKPRLRSAGIVHYTCPNCAIEICDGPVKLL